MYLNEICASLLTANVIFLLWCLKGQKFFGDTKVSLQNGLLNASLTRPLYLILGDIHLYY